LTVPAPQRRKLLGLAALVVVVAVVVALATGGGGGGKQTVTAATVVVRHAQPVGGVRTIRFRKGTIDLTVRSDTADEIHFHGYDVHRDVTKGGTVRFRMPARIEGVFVVELESHKTQIASVEVLP
jgi:hypothetical protein